MSRSNHHRERVKNLSRLFLFITSIVIASLLGGCDGGLFGTGTGDNSEIIEPVASGAPQTEEPGDTPDSSASPEAPSDNNAESDSSPITISLNNTTPSGIDQSTVTLPSLKLINLTEFSISVATPESQSINQSVSVSPQATSELLEVNTGETMVTLRREDDDVVLASLNPLNAAADSLTTLIIETQELATNNSSQEGESLTSLIALDTQAAVTASGMAEVRIVSAGITNAETAARSFTLTPTIENSSGVELVITYANTDNSAVGTYSLANAGSYVLSSDDNSFSSQPITLSANTVYTIVITNNPQLPIYVEVDSLSDE